MAAGTMVELAAANGDIDTSDQLEMFEAFQKVVVVNGSKLKIIDFINTKLTVTALTTAPSVGSTVTQANTNATMVVDFVSSDKTKIYGYVTSGTFNTTAGNTLSGGGMDPETRVPSAIAYATTTPHWYDYTVYPGGSSGSLPSTAYLGCLYRGRVVLAGNPAYPYQWYMSRQGKIFDYLYTAGDAQSPVAGTNADAGAAPDIIRALIPYHDDYLIFGCANSMHVLRGDPAAGGSRDLLDSTVGIFGSRSWCFDGDGNLFFWGSGGVYFLSSDFSSLKCITAISLPNLIKDEAADPSTHRVTMAYDRRRYGIIIAITVLSTGVNSNYFLSLLQPTYGMFPETYPEECSIYSMCYYDSNNKSYADMLCGCRDGYIRKYDSTALNDDIGNTNEAISAYIVYPIKKLSDKDDYEGKLTRLAVQLGGGAADGTFSDTDAVTYEVFTGDDAETVIEDIRDGATAVATGTLTGPGRKNQIRVRARGAYAAIKFSNSTATQTFIINKVTGRVVPAGRIK